MTTSFLRKYSFVVLCFLSAHILRADNSYSFDITSDQKRLDAKPGSAGIGVTSKMEEWCYKVVLVNRSFKDALNVEIKYYTFMKPDVAGERAQPGDYALKRSKQGDVLVPVIKNLDKYEFSTDPMTLVLTQLKPGYVWKSGSAASTRDALKGLWMRVYVNGQQVAEYITPTSIKDRESWDVK